MKNIERYTPDIKCGLTNYEVDKRIKDNLVNIYTEVGTKTVSEIVKENVLTLFNIINIDYYYPKSKKLNYTAKITLSKKKRHLFGTFFYLSLSTRITVIFHII